MNVMELDHDLFGPLPVLSCHHCGGMLSAVLFYRNNRDGRGYLTECKRCHWDRRHLIGLLGTSEGFTPRRRARVLPPHRVSPDGFLFQPSDETEHCEPGSPAEQSEP